MLSLNDILYKDLLDLSSDFYFQLFIDSDKIFNLEYESEGFFAVTGYTLEELLPLGGITHIVHQDDKAIIEHHNRSVLQRQHMVNEFRIIPKDKAVRWIRLNSKPFWSIGEDNIFRIISSGMDITHRKQVENEILASEKMYRFLIHNLYNSLYDGVIVHSPNGEVLTYNERALELLDINKDQLVGKEAIDFGWSLISEEGFDLQPENFPANQVINNRKPYHNYVLGVRRPQKKDVIWCLVNAFPVFDKNFELTQVVVTYIDITKRILAEKSLKESEEKFRAIFNESMDAIMIIDYDLGLINQINPASQNIFGFTTTELIGKPFSILIPNSNSLHGMNLGELLIANGDLSSSQIFLKADGSPCPMEFTATLIPWGATKAILVTFRDISERTKAEKEKQQYIRRLEVVREIDQAILTSQTAQSIAVAVLEHISKLIPTAFGRILLIEHQERKIIKITTLAQSVEMNFLNIKEEIDNEHTNHIIQLLSRGEIRKNNDLERNLNKSSYETILFSDNIRSYVFIPLILKGDLLGTLNLMSHKPFSFTYEQLEIILDVASSLSVAIQHAQLFEQLRLRIIEQETLLQMSMDLRKAENRFDIVNILLNKTGELIKSPSGGFLRLDVSSFTLEQGYGLEKTPVGNKIHKLDLPFWQDIQKGDNVYRFNWDNFENNAIFKNLDSSVFNSIVVIPLRIREEIIGLLYFLLTEKIDLSPEVYRLLSSVAMLGGSALHRASFTEVLEKRVADRTRELTTMYEVTLLSSKSHGLHTILEKSLSMILKDIDCVAGSVHVKEESGKMLKLIAHKGIPPAHLPLIRSISFSNVANFLDSQFKRIDSDSLAEIPPEIRLQCCDGYFGTYMHVKGHVIGILGIYKIQIAEFTEEEKSLISVIADLLGIAIENSRLQKIEEERAIEEERKRIARELHDSVTQSLYSLALNADSANKLLVLHDYVRLDRYLKDIKENAYAVLKEMRLLLYELHSTTIDERGGLIEELRFRLESVERRSGIDTELVADADIKLSRFDQWEVYRIVIEALNNALKHASASSITLEIKSFEKKLIITINDNGKGFDPNNITPGGMGLRNMRTRAKKLGGIFEISSQINMGTKVRITLANKS